MNVTFISSTIKKMTETRENSVSQSVAAAAVSAFGLMEEGKEEQRRSFSKKNVSGAEGIAFLSRENLGEGRASSEMRGGDSSIVETETIPLRQPDSPKKRAFALAAFLTCMSGIVVIIELIVSFASEITKNDRLLDRISSYYDNKNNTCVCNETLFDE